MQSALLPSYQIAAHTSFRSKNSVIFFGRLDPRLCRHPTISSPVVVSFYGRNWVLAQLSLHSSTPTILRTNSIFTILQQSNEGSHDFSVKAARANEWRSCNQTHSEAWTTEETAQQSVTWKDWVTGAFFENEYSKLHVS